MPVQHELRLKPGLSGDLRTDGKDDAADKIMQLQEEGELKGLSAREISEKIGWSRSHVQAVLEEYFEPADAGNTVDHSHDGRRLTIEIPDDVENERDYLRGYIDGMQR